VTHYDKAYKPACHHQHASSIIAVHSQLDHVHYIITTQPSTLPVNTDGVEK